MKRNSLYMWRNVCFIAVAWSVFIIISILFQVNHIKSSTIRNALIEARTALDKDISYRYWNSNSEGVYMEISEDIPPNPYLDIEQRDLVTTNGKQLTRINPAYMTRLVLEQQNAAKDVLGRISSLDPINPENAPDEWERRVLRSFKRGEESYSSIEEIDGDTYLRYIRSFAVEKSCLKCHGRQGYELGDIRGGISISVPMGHQREVEWNSIKNSVLIHFLLWLTGIFGLSIGGWKMDSQLISQQKAEDENKELEIKLLHAERLEAVGQLAAGIAHEINTPAQFLATNLDFMNEAIRDIANFVTKVETITEEMPPEFAGKTRRAIEEADWNFVSKEMPLAIRESQDGISRVSDIVQAMKEFSKPASHVMEPQDVNKIIDSTTIVARNEWKYVVDLRLDLEPGLPRVFLSSDEIGQVILNMLINAVHAVSEKLGTNPKGKKGIISISTWAEKDSVKIRISDTGTGIPENVRSRIFDLFFTTKEVENGTGQGLAICHNVICNKYSGSIEFTTEPGKGTDFVIELPLRQGESL